MYKILVVLGCMFYSHHFVVVLLGYLWSSYCGRSIRIFYRHHIMVVLLDVIVVVLLGVIQLVL